MTLALLLGLALHGTPQQSPVPPNFAEPPVISLDLASFRHATQQQWIGFHSDGVRRLCGVPNRCTGAVSQQYVQTCEVFAKSCKMPKASAFDHHNGVIEVTTVVSTVIIFVRTHRGTKLFIGALGDRVCAWGPHRPASCFQSLPQS